MSLTKTQIISLKKAGLSGPQITKLSDTIKEVEALTTNDLDKLVAKISTDQGFLREFLKDPIVSLGKIGIRAARVGTNPSTGE